MGVGEHELYQSKHHPHTHSQALVYDVPMSVCLEGWRPSLTLLDLEEPAAFDWNRSTKLNFVPTNLKLTILTHTYTPHFILTLPPFSTSTLLQHSPPSYPHPPPTPFLPFPATSISLLTSSSHSFRPFPIYILLPFPPLAFPSTPSSHSFPPFPIYILLPLPHPPSHLHPPPTPTPSSPLTSSSHSHTLLPTHTLLSLPPLAFPSTPSSHSLKVLHKVIKHLYKLSHGFIILKSFHFHYLLHLFKIIFLWEGREWRDQGRGRRGREGRERRGGKEGRKGGEDR